ncbi:tagaturonate reductase [Alteribacillus sp. YIM 98480]|uniref:tagaturonate reductase n=1 Tax=Alteribacillus sp. YIM 98480 TaxID=2606599 RepID=UPI00131BB7B1|nr:tagaturonate reductase [Alteribacillus sp. YIM 98480]
MERLSKSLIQNREDLLNQTFNKKDFPEKVLQIGEGNFLRGFVDWMIERMNRQGVFQGRIVAVQPTPHGRKLPDLKKQDGAYTVVLRGQEDGQIVDQAEVVTAISRGINPYEEWDELVETACSEDIEVVISNTTEAGLTYQEEEYKENQAVLSYPGKLTQLLYQRYQAFQGAADKGWVILPCELVQQNGTVLKDLVLRKIKEWSLGSSFQEWVLQANTFCETLVDRIVTGYPYNEEKELKERFGYEDKLMTVGEPYHLFVIEGDQHVREVLPFGQTELNVRFAPVDDYAELKIRLLNAPHTMMFALGYLHGKDTVYESMRDREIRSYVEKMIDAAIKPVLPYEDKEKDDLAASVLERFENPYQRHLLTDLGQNGLEKFKTRVLPLWKRWEGRSTAANHYFALALAGVLAYYQPAEKNGEKVKGLAKGREIPLREKESTITYMHEQWQLVYNSQQSLHQLAANVLRNPNVWDENLSLADKEQEKVGTYLEAIIQYDAQKAFQLLNDNVKEEV